MSEVVKSYLRSLELPPIPSIAIHQGVADETTAVFDAAKNQAQVVGGSLFSFVQGVTPEVRTAISNSALLAQLVANKKYSAEANPLDWYRVYNEVLHNVGWVIQTGEWNKYEGKGTIAEVHQQLIEVLGAAITGGPAAALIKSAIDALTKIQKDQANGSWLRIFSRETQKARISRFQVGLAEPGADADVFITLLCCVINASKTVTEVLVFKFKAENADFTANLGKVSVNKDSIEAIGPAIRQKVLDYQTAYLSSIKDLAV